MITSIPQTEAGFLADIIETPEDDAPRLIYCDWLQENVGTAECVRCRQGENPIYTAGVGRLRWHLGDGTTGVVDCPDCSGTGRVPDGRAERAEFIRVQVELACFRRAVGAEHLPHAREEALRRRERELFDWNNVSNWGFRDYVLRTTVDRKEFDRLVLEKIDAALIRRGFVEHVTLSAEDFLRHADELVKAAPIREVTLTTWPGVGQDFYAEASVVSVFLSGRHTGNRLGITRKEMLAQTWDQMRPRVVCDLLTLEFPRIEKFNLPTP
jgi:uncharacterized protein (TIGR02996 family)